MNNNLLRIVLADDDIDDRFFFKKAVNELSFETNLSTVEDGEELMAYLAENLEQLPDILFLDLSMPRKSGFECLSEIKKDPKLQNISIVMFSTFHTKDINYEKGMKSMLYEIGAEEYIRKPDDFSKLKTIIHTSLTKILDKKLLNKI